MKNILITGVSGFVGTNLVDYFKRRGDLNIIGHSRNSSSVVKLINDLQAKTLDISKIDVVIHLAGIAHDLSGRFKADDYYQVNTEGTKRIVDEYLKSNASKFVFISSIKAACDTSASPADESMKPNPVSAYGKSKLMAEEYIQSLEWKHGKSYHILRPAMIHGPGNKGNLNLLYRFVKSGIPFPFGAFYNQRSFHSIENLCFIIQSLIEKDIEQGIYHAADSGFLSTVQLYELISETLGKKPRSLNLSRGMINVLATLVGKRSMINKLTENMMVSNEKIVKAVGTLPVGLEEGLKETIRSFDGK
ncbi:nucleoside-diphosphate-sugar epimerase [Cytophagales bacterium WSM2-2]|nr:nucleoside-diphosphate-sugar epimerase [Cytophagales bacterium WSM2-2]